MTDDEAEAILAVDWACLWDHLPDEEPFSRRGFRRPAWLCGLGGHHHGAQLSISWVAGETWGRDSRDEEEVKPLFLHTCVRCGRTFDGPDRRMPSWLCRLLGGHRAWITVIDSARLVEASLSRTVKEIDPRLGFTMGLDHVTTHHECRRCGRKLD
jgi:hypothetical protein